MAGKKRKVSFYKISLERFNFIKETNNVKVDVLSNDELFQYFKKLHDNKMKSLTNNHRATTVSTASGDYVIEIIEFDNDNRYSYIKIGRQNPSNTVALRDTETLETEVVPMSKSQLLELFTYCLIDFKTGIISYIGVNGAPRISVIKSLFDDCFYEDENIEAKLASIMTDDILKTLTRKDIISKLTLTVSIPDDKILSEKIGLNMNDFDSLQNVKTRTVSYKLVASRNKNIFSSSGNLAKFIASITSKLGDNVLRLTANAKDYNENSQVYDLLHYNFTKTVVLEGINDNATANEQLFKDALLDTYRTNKNELLRYCKI